MHAPGGARPHYATTSRGQLRLQIAGHGPTVVVLVGPTQSAAWVAGRLSETLGDSGAPRRVVAVEMPGTGGSSRLRSTDSHEAGTAIAEALTWLAAGPGTHTQPIDLVAIDLAAALAPPVVASLRPAQVLLAGLEEARGWAAHRVIPPPGSPTTDGSHLLALWTFLRDRRLLRADDPTLARSCGAPAPGVEELSDAFVAAATDPVGFGAWWQRATDGLEAAVPQLAGPVTTELDGPLSLDAIVGALASTGPHDPAASTGSMVSAEPPATSADVDGEIWHHYVDTPMGLAHVRRIGPAHPVADPKTGSHRPVLVLSTGGGSSQQFAPVVRGLAVDGERRRAVASLDYFGNGLSGPRPTGAEGPDRPDVADLAREALAVVDALGWDQVDLWGSHTGACVALEAAIAALERIGRLVLEAPPMVDPALRDDLLTHYFPDLTPDRFGAHLPRVWAWRRDAFLYWPWYSVDPASARGLGMPSPEELQQYAVGILESGSTYGGAYRAAFAYDTRGRLPLLRRPALLTAGPHDMLANTLADAARLVPDALLRIEPTPATMWWPDPGPEAAAATLRTYQEFLR